MTEGRAERIAPALLPPPPDISQEEIEELVMLRVKFGVSALEAEHGLPGWERDLLVALAKREAEPPQEDSLPDDPLGAIPADYEE